MIALTGQPASLIFAQNVANFKLLSTHDDSSLFAAVGMQQSLLLVENDDVYAGARITINLTEPSGATYSIVFDFVTSPSTEQQLPTYQVNPSPPRPNPTYEVYYQDLAARMARSPALSPFLKVSFSYNSGTNVSTITFTAIDTQTTFSIAVVSLSVATVSITTLAMPDTTPANYRAVYELFSELDYGSGMFKSLFSGESIPNVAGLTRINIQNILTAFVGAIRFVPPNCTTVPAHRANHIRRYYFRYTEKYGAPTTQQAWTTTAIKKMITGGIPNNVALRADWLATRTIDTCFLNTLPDDRLVAQNSPEFVVWYNYTDVFQSLKVEWKVWLNTDGSDTTGINSVISLYASPNETLMIPALKSHDYPDNAAAVEIRLLDQTNTPVSGWRRYTIDRRYREDERYLMFLNQYGVFESVRLTGATAMGVELERRESIRYKDDVIETFEAEKKWRRSFSYRTGYLSQEECRALENLVASRFVFEVSLTEGYIPVRITDTKFTLDDGKQDLWALEIKAVPQLEYGAPTTDLWLKW